MARAGDGNIAEARVEQVGMDAGIGMYQDPLYGDALGAMAGDGVAVIEMAMLGGVELNQPVAVEPCADTSIRRDGLDYGKVAVRDAE